MLNEMKILLTNITSNALKKETQTNSKMKVINTKFCKFSVVDNAATATGLNISKEEVKVGNADFDIWWHDEPSKCTKEHMKNLKSHQKVNHFPAMSELVIKTQLGRNLNRGKLFFPQHYDFHPLTFVLPKVILYRSHFDIQ
jgi:tubulin polyglutamylase TTLL6/13